MKILSILYFFLVHLITSHCKGKPTYFQQYQPLKPCHYIYINSYRKNSKNWDTVDYYRDCPTNGIVGFYSAILRSKDADRITNRVDTDQTAP